MPETMHCQAPWFELNISSADDCVSACCYYGGAKDAWADEYRSVDAYWNSENFQRLRTINSPWRGEIPEEQARGCENCFYFRNRDKSASYFPAFFNLPSDLTAEQQENWELAIEDYQANRRVVKSTPLRFYINFGFACNLSCTMCHQVPRRDKLKRQVDADILTRWKPQLRRAIDVTVIGGEPFALPQAIKFIRAFIDDPDLENVQLTICTNGTVHHKHMKTLVKKRKLQLTVSLDTIGAEYEKIRVGAKWSQVDENIRMFLETGAKLGYPWQAQSPALVLKTNVPRLYDFAQWAITNGVQPGFYDFIDSPGVEHTFETENIVAHPELLDEVPGWERHFESAIELLKNSQFSGAGEQLRMLYSRVVENYERMRERRAAISAIVRANYWASLFVAAGSALTDCLELSVYAPGAIPNERLTREEFGGRFSPSDPNDHVTTPLVAVGPPGHFERYEWILLTLRWGDQPDLESAIPRARYFVQRDGFYRLPPSHSIADAGTTRDYFQIDPAVHKMRVVFMAADLETVALPESITFEGTYAPAAERGRAA